ncbi:uncharacterized protein LOC119545857 isoform X2 [Drosophila subpulchrella]|uniref:uncharacterized protein LOC119545857 isoform X2 n=1 Tax=Drosophila subpulchrella TaxID=1486046 RepID=UPI0018A1322E|nr:uncharacterized protein LOC119545857 isoform X2 [Drosophila subpulchrella]
MAGQDAVLRKLSSITSLKVIYRGQEKDFLALLKIRFVTFTMRHEIFGTRNRNDKKSIPECSPLKSPALNAVTKIMGKVGWGRNGFVGACDFKNPKNVSDRMLSATMKTSIIGLASYQF